MSPWLAVIFNRFLFKLFDEKSLLNSYEWMCHPHRCRRIMDVHRFGRITREIKGQQLRYSTAHFNLRANSHKLNAHSMATPLKRHDNVSPRGEVENDGMRKRHYSRRPGDNRVLLLLPRRRLNSSLWRAGSKFPEGISFSVRQSSTTTETCPDVYS